MPIINTSLTSSSVQSRTKYERKIAIIGDYVDENFVFTPTATGYLQEGTVLARHATVEGKVVEYDPAATTGAQHIVGVLALGRDVISGTDVTLPVCVRGIVNGDNLAFKSGVTITSPVTSKGYSVKHDFYANTRIEVITNIVDITY